MVFKNRFIEPELLDHAAPEEARANLADLVRLNQSFGGHSTTAKILSQVALPEDQFTLLDVGAASGDTGRFISRSYPNAKITSLDNKVVNVEAAAHPKLIADGFDLPFAPQSFDFVFCSLFLHHFTDDQVVQLLSGFAVVARRAVLVSDLERHFLPYWFLPATQAFFKWSHVTVHDGRISVRASFTRCELERLAAAAGMRNFSAAVHRPAFRVSLVARK